MSPEQTEDHITTVVVEPDIAPTKFIRLLVDDEEIARIPWREAEAIADTVADEREGDDE